MIAAPVLIGAAVALALGTYGSVHDPTGRKLFTLVFTATLNMKAWLATIAITLAIFQIASALRIYARVSWPRHVPTWLGDAHRLSGTLAFIVSLPVAYHCLWSLGFESSSGELRRFVHSIAGCFFYGAFTTKVLAVRSHSLPSWMLPIVGGAVFASLVVIWLTSSLWFFQNVGFPEL